MGTVKSLWEILLPCHHPDGSRFSIEHHRIFDEQVRQISGGMTILHSAVGEWEQERERMIPVRFMADSYEVRQLARFAKQHYEQKAILAYCISDEIVMIKDV